MTETRQAIGLMDAIYGRRSVRTYTGERVDQATVRTLLAAAVRAPTAMHREPWSFVVLHDPVVLRRLSDRAKALLVEEANRANADPGGRLPEAFFDPAFDIFYGSGTLVVICGPAAGPFVAADCWLAAENLMLAAHAQGLGTCVIGCALPALNEPPTKAELGIPPDASAVAPIVVGVPRGESPRTTRKDPLVLTWK